MYPFLAPPVLLQYYNSIPIPVCLRDMFFSLGWKGRTFTAVSKRTTVFPFKLCKKTEKNNPWPFLCFACKYPRAGEAFWGSCRIACVINTCYYSKTSAELLSPYLSSVEKNTNWQPQSTQDYYICIHPAWYLLVFPSCYLFICSPRRVLKKSIHPIPNPSQCL